MTNRKKPDIETLSSTEVYRNPWTRVREDRIRRIDGSEGIYGVVDKPDFVIVAALEDGKVHLVQQYRYPVAGRFWELPQGALHDGATFDLFNVAETELRQETGLTAETLRYVGKMHPGYGICSHTFHVFLATGLTKGEAEREQEEQDQVDKAFPVSEVIEMIKSGKLMDSNSVAAFYLLQLHGHLDAHLG